MTDEQRTIKLSPTSSHFSRVVDFYKEESMILAASLEQAMVTIETLKNELAAKDKK